jgi:hypothetical protein
MSLADLRRAFTGWRLRVADRLRGSPGTVAYFLAILVTTLSVRDLNRRQMHLLIRAQSTNWSNLTHHPVRVLFLSAFWLDSTSIPLMFVIMFLVVLAPTERRIGTARWLAVGAATHVVATLLSEAGVSWAAHHGVVPARLLHTTDVGISYFTYGVTAVACTLLPRRIRPWAVVGLLGYMLWHVVSGQTYTDWGHLQSVLIGLLLARWATRGAEPFEFPRVARLVPTRA